MVWYKPDPVIMMAWSVCFRLLLNVTVLLFSVLSLLIGSGCWLILWWESLGLVHVVKHGFQWYSSMVLVYCGFVVVVCS